MDLFNQLISALGKENVRRDEPLSKHTTFRIGGPADFFITPKDKGDLTTALQIAEEQKVPVYYFGNGSNILFGDRGYRGMVVRIGKGLDRMEWIRDTTIQAGAGVLLSKLASTVASRCLTGLEFAAGIPGSLGGAVTMNAGAYGGEIKDCIISVKGVDLKGGGFHLSKEELGLGYRTSVIQEKEWILTSATFTLQKGDGDEIQETMTRLNQKRREKQPLEHPSAGSTFKRPQGRYAGKLIEEAGLKGRRIGDAVVSPKHCGFVVNMGNATAKDVLELIHVIQNEVKHKFEVDLEPEVRLVGEF